MTARDAPRSGEFPIVGVGASAGGLEAFSQLLQNVGEDGAEMALVLIQHLDPTHTSFLREALAKTTNMHVVEATEQLRIEKNHVYVIPPNTCLGITADHLALTSRPDDPKVPHLPIDFFFRSLAAERESRAIGVVLSGTASDGTAGLRAIKDASGITFAQDPATAKFDGMPSSALEAGVVDYRLPIAELARELVRLAHHPYLVASESAAPARDDATMGRIIALVRAAVRVDFSEYKAPTFQRRLARRMALRRVDDLGAYLALLESSSAEVSALAEDALIHVTSFFREGEVFESLKTTVFPAIVEHKADDAPIRVWAAGCSTGEEVYSLAIALVEFLGDSSRPIQIFGSDVSSAVIEKARAGLYPESAIRDVSDERRRRYFTKTDRGYRIAKSIRDLCVFVQHDLAHDPPFSKLDLVSCRNVLIYFDQALQQRVVPTLHYALSQPGFLLLGRAEAVSGFKQLFRPIDRTNKVFARTDVASTLRFARRLETEPTAPPRERNPSPRPEVELSTRIDRMLLARYAPPGIVVNERMEILQYRGRTGGYLAPAPGAPHHNVMQMARDGLAMTLRATIAAAKKAAATATEEDVEITEDGHTKRCNLVVIPLAGASGRDALYLVLFEAIVAPARQSPPGDAADDARRTPKLEQELAATKEYLQSVIADHGRANEDLGAANDELVTGNEELQSMNEELETAKEELQSINEELTTVNDELQSRNQEVTVVNGDLVNLLTTVDIPILILDRDRKIRRFTPKARRLLNVLPSDVGRPFEDIKPNVDVPDLDRQIAEVIESMTVRESEVQDREGHWHRLQIRPYRTTDNRIDGAIVSLLDIDALKHLVKEAQLANTLAEQANATKDEFLSTLSHELRTPLSSMLMRAQLLRRGPMDEAKVRRAGEAIEAGVKMQVQLIDDLLDVSRIVTGKLHLDLQPVSLADVITAAVDGVAHAVERKAITLELDLVRGPPDALVYGDERRLSQIVANLLGNAIKFTPKLGTVRVSLAIEDGNAVVRIRDTGIGIEPSFLPSVFDRFAQENSTSSRSTGGLGLGLAIVRHLVELHHGTVRAESAGTGRGATFSLTIPLMKALRGVLPEAHGLARVALDTAALSGLRILVVDDDRATRETIADLLEESGAEVRLAPSAAEAMTAVDSFHPALLVCDIEMPGEDGYSFIRKLRARGPARSGDIPALAFTALARDEDRVRALGAGFQMHLAKPADVDRLTSAVLALAATRGNPRSASS